MGFLSSESSHSHRRDGNNDSIKPTYTLQSGGAGEGQFTGHFSPRIARGAAPATLQPDTAEKRSPLPDTDVGSVAKGEAVHIPAGGNHPTPMGAAGWGAISYPTQEFPVIVVDLTPVSPHATDAALEMLFKSNHDHDKGIWNPHESVLIRRLVELFTQRGLDRLEHVKQQILAWEAGEHHKPGAPVPTNVPGMMARWSDAELGLVRIYLEALPPGAWTINDHMMAVDYVVQRYLPAEEMHTEAQWMATRASLMGKVQANMAAPATPAQADKVLAALPSTAAAAGQQFALSARLAAVMAFGNARAAENVRALAEDVRHRMRTTVMQHLEQQAVQAPGTPGEALQTKLLDQFGTLNRDWRRIAVTESGECQTQGYIASLPIGSRVKRIEQYASACAFCKKIHGKIATVVSPDKPDKDWENEIWAGKNNIGRSASPRKRVGDQLIDRTPDEMWALPAGLAHPHCRGRWVPHDDGAEPGDDPDFAAWLEATLSN